MESQSKTDQLIYRISYRNHKKRLTQIKQHNTSLQFYNAGKNKPEDRKKILMLKMKRQEIQMENQILQEKIAKIQGKKIQKQSLKVKEIKNTKNKNRYEDDNEEDGKIQVKSDYGDGETKICIVPYTSKRPKIISHSSTHKRSQHYNPVNPYTTNHQNKSPEKDDNEQSQGENHGKQEKKTNSHPYFSQPKQKGLIFSKLSSIRESISKPEDQKLYHDPEKESNRLVMYKRTRIPEPMLSYLIEISLIKKSLLITAYAMGIYNHTIKLVLEPKKSQDLIREVDEDYQKIWERVIIDSATQTMKIGEPVYQQNQQVQSQPLQTKKQIQSKSAQKKYHIQQEFLRRNYDTIMENKMKNENNTITNQEKSKQKQKYESRSNSKKTPSSSFRHTKIGDEWKIASKIDKKQQSNLSQSQNEKKTEEKKIEKKEIAKKEEVKKETKKPTFNNKSDVVKENSIKFKEKKNPTENASVLKNESLKSKKIDNLSNISSIKGKTNISKEQSIKQSYLKSNKEEEQYEQQFEDNTENKNISNIKESKLEKSEDYAQEYEEQYENEQKVDQEKKQKEEENYDISYEQEEEKKNKNQSNIRDSMVYEQDFEENNDNKDNEKKQKNQSVEIDEDYAEEFEN